MIIKQEKALFEEWRKTREDGFSEDGIINPGLYLSSSPKIMFILKEANSKTSESVDLKKNLNRDDFKRKPTWDNIARWIHGIRNLDKEIPWEDLEKGNHLNEERQEIITSICLINVKKSSGGYKADSNKLYEIAKVDKELLNRQFQLYFNNIETRPDFIIAGGSDPSKIFNLYSGINKLDGWKTTSRGIQYFEFDPGRFYIKFSHPEARIADSVLYYALIDAIKEIRTK